MAITAKVFSKFPLSLMNKEADLNTDTIKCALFTNAHAPSQDDDQYYDAANGMTEVSTANGYTAGGVAVGTPTISTAGKVTTFDSVDPAWTVTGAGFTYRYAEFYDDSPGSNKPLISYVDFGEDISAVAGTHSIILDASGIAKITVS
jgi:hypothetical protein